MNKKLLISLAAIFAAAAFAVMPAAAHAACTPPACPHVYKNGVIGGEGKRVRYIEWGTWNITNAHIGGFECRTATVGYLENQVGGGAARGEVQGVAWYECVWPTCTTVLGGTAIRLTPGQLPWAAEVFEDSERKFRQKTGHKGPTPGKEPNPVTEPEFIQFLVDCTGVTTTTFFGEQDPLLLNNGTAIGAGPGEEKLEPEKVNANAKDLESELSGRGETESGSPGFKVEGYGAEELLEVKNP
jgi:hypothetical protein